MPVATLGRLGLAEVFDGEVEGFDMASDTLYAFSSGDH
jgi:hypothetical protein